MLRTLSKTPFDRQGGARIREEALMTILERVDRRLDNMKMMLERFDIDPIAFSSQDHGRYLAAALPSCLACPCDEACHDWLILIGGETRLDQVPAFCPNSQLFAWAKQDQVRSETR
jgi:hypothetical protein